MPAMPTAAPRIYHDDDHDNPFEQEPYTDHYPNPSHNITSQSRSPPPPGLPPPLASSTVPPYSDADNFPTNDSSHDIPLRETAFNGAQSGNYPHQPLPTHSDSQLDLAGVSRDNYALPAAGAAAGYSFSSPNQAFGPRSFNMNNTGRSFAESGSLAGGAKPMGSTTNILDSGPSPWLLEQQKRQKRSKWMVCGCILAVIGIVVIAVTVGVVVSNNNKKNNRTTSSGSTSGGSSVVNQTDPNDPSSFVKDPNLHVAFYGMAYTPVGSQLPDCGNSLGAVIQDIQLLSQLTTRIRLYGADCNQSALVLEAIKQTKVNMSVWLGNYPIPTDAGAAYERQRDLIKDAITNYGTDHIAGITVGNEFMLNYLNANGASDPNSAVGDAGAQLLITNITDTRTMLASMSLGKTLPVGTSDAGSYFNTKVLSAVDYGMANVHPWFANVSADQSAGWTADFFQQQDVDQANALSNKPQMYIAETGWPTKSSDAGNESNGASTASEANLQKFLDTFVCQANTNGTGYFFFEFCDEEWKDIQFGGVEGWWGLFNGNRTLKNVKIPTCSSP